jgi:hypothetical protein
LLGNSELPKNLMHLISRSPLSNLSRYYERNYTEFSGVGGPNNPKVNQQYQASVGSRGFPQTMGMPGAPGAAMAHAGGYVGKSKIKSSGGSVRSKSMRSRGSHMSNRRRMESH